MSLRIAELLEDKSFGFSHITLKTYTDTYLKIYIALQEFTESITLLKKRIY